MAPNSPKEIGGRDCFFDLEETTSPYDPITRPEPPKKKPVPISQILQVGSSDPFWHPGNASRNNDYSQPTWFKPKSMPTRFWWEDTHANHSLEPIGGRDIFLDAHETPVAPDDEPDEKPPSPKVPNGRRQSDRHHGGKNSSKSEKQTSPEQRAENKKPEGGRGDDGIDKDEGKAGR